MTVTKMKYYPMDIAEFLNSDEEIQGYLEECQRAAIEDNNPGLFANAVQDAIRAHGVLQLAKAMGMPYDDVYNMVYAARNVPANIATNLAKALSSVPEHT